MRIELTSLTAVRRFVQVSSLAIVGWFLWVGWALILATLVIIGGLAFSYILTRVIMRLRPATAEGPLLLNFFVTYLIVVGLFADWNSRLYAHPWWKNLEILIASAFIALLFGALVWPAIYRFTFKKR